MEVKKYPYSKYQIWFAFSLSLAMMAFPVFMIATDTTDRQAWLLFGFFFLAICGILTYLIRKYFLPMQRGETALELDKEKLQYFIGNKIVYWKDILYMDFGEARNGIFIRFALEHGVDITIGTRFVAGKDNEIYDTISAYFEKYK
ncbi:hypothetical protein [uncultured Mucilaginibacter sp.]|uniref:hypothetical protein n=1 Tax=uncultured Mucilaginibacter sp. TaxID=797541 RepID=UPI0025F70C7B|nr:hypothetical protein [uncultured Mucilaginibacter sp.]